MSAERGAHVPDLILEQYRLNELPPEEANRLAARLRADAALRERLEAIEKSDQDIKEQHPPDALAQRVRERMPSRTRPSGIRRLVLATALTGSAAAIAFALPWSSPWSVMTPAAGGDRGDRGDRIKGLTPALSVYRRTPAGSETLANGAPARTGDLLRLGYVSAGRGYGVILSIDGRGVVTLHLPPNGTRAAALRGGGTILLDQAYELDDAPAWERFYFVTAEQPFEVAPVMDAARRAAARDLRAPPETLPIPSQLGQSTFSIQKEVKP
jgi:hypothetical protein